MSVPDGAAAGTPGRAEHRRGPQEAGAGQAAGTGEGHGGADRGRTPPDAREPGRQAGERYRPTDERDTAGARDAPEAADGRAAREELERLRAEVHDLRARARVYPLISQAQGILRERYALPDAESAFALLQRASQRYNVKLRTLAGVLVTVPGPEPGSGLWFPRRVRAAEPALGFARPEPGNRSAVLSAVLSRTLAVVDAEMGNVQLADRAAGGLRMERHTGLTADFVDFFGHVGREGTSCALAARDVAQVTVRDVESDPVFTEPARAAILAAGSRSCHSVPLTVRTGLCVGMVSAHAGHRLKPLTKARTEALDALGAEAGRWLTWYDRTVVRDALEYLHVLGQVGRGRSFRRG
ncbi:ANTAR domain-containing protein [Streptomyces sp. NPDC047000]|uniref:ANTAR domain-containing protein n=1 Tax=Streptomyces sp. NPDC047000 TaxID=3155474 RepID=UPI0033F27711